MATKPSKKKSVNQPAAKKKAKASAKKPAPKKTPPAKKPVAKKAEAKKPAKKDVKKPEAKKPVAKKPEPKKPAAKDKPAPATSKASKDTKKDAAPSGKNGAKAKADLFAPAPERDINQFIADKTRELVKLAKDQGYLTFDKWLQDIASDQRQSLQSGEQILRWFCRYHKHLYRYSLGRGDSCMVSSLLRSCSIHLHNHS